MVDRQDIDALLIGSLYGELSSTEEARLAAHLESHPADRTALADLTRAREAVRESRILQVQFEPPHSISALLMQEAVRRAPKPKDEQSWFQRFMRGFMMHPAMAAAAMLVVVAGVAGTMYLRKGDHFAKETAGQPATLTETSNASEGRPGPADDGGEIAATFGRDAAATENFEVGLAEGADRRNKASDDETGFGLQKQQDADGLERQLAFEERKKAEALKGRAEDRAEDKPAKVATKKAPPRNYLEVTTPDQSPKDFSDAKGGAAGSATVARGDATKSDSGRTAVGGAPAPGSLDTTSSKPPSTSPPRVAQPAPPAPATPVPDKPAEKPSPELAWAKEQHQKVIAQVKAGKCNQAAAIAVQISSRNPTYFAANVEEDRQVKPCMAYITQQREREAERVQRAKATQRRTVDEPARAAPTSTK